jgi:Zn-finger nucleic acid-binding protein
MDTVRDENIKIDRCNRCHGIYFDHLSRQDVQAVIGETDIDTGDATTGAEYDEMLYVECPKCDMIMDQRIVEEPVAIRFEICTGCYSTFLDAGEFSRYMEDDYRDTFISLLPEA